jgi:hypothetical protein
MVTVMKSRTTDVRIFFSDLVDFAIYVVRSGGATIFLSDKLLRFAFHSRVLDKCGNLALSDSEVPLIESLKSKTT